MYADKWKIRNTVTCNIRSLVHTAIKYENVTFINMFTACVTYLCFSQTAFTDTVCGGTV